MDLIATALLWASVVAFLLAFYIMAQGASSSETQDADAWPDAANPMTKPSSEAFFDRADNPYTDEDDFSFREPGWHPPEHRYREEDKDSI
jgi:hypothetical protein